MPDTRLRWHRELVAQKWDYSEKRKPSGQTSQGCEDLNLSFAKENPSWGNDRIRAVLENLSHYVSNSNASDFLNVHSVEPASGLYDGSNSFVYF